MNCSDSRRSRIRATPRRTSSRRSLPMWRCYPSRRFETTVVKVGVVVDGVRNWQGVLYVTRKTTPAVVPGFTRRVEAIGYGP
jgi:hypothetical protein